MSESSERKDSSKLIRRVSYPRVRTESKNNNFKMARPNPADPPPLNKDHVFKMSYDTRDIHAAAIPMGSMNVMTSLKEKIAAKSATGSISGLPKKTPSRVHALLQEQLGVEEEQEEERFRSDQTNTVPSKVFQALQYSIPGPDVQYVPPSENRKPPSISADDDEYVRFRSDQMNTVPSKVFQALQYCYPGDEPNTRRSLASKASPVHEMREPEDDSEYERFHGNPANRVPSKVFKALQYTYDTKEPVSSSEDMQFARRQDGQFQVNPSKKSVNHVPSKAFQMLQKQYSEEQESSLSTDAISADLQDALDLLEQELDAMTSAKTNPVISVPLSKGATNGRNQRISSDAMKSVPFENKMIQVPLYKGVPKSNNYNRMDQQPAMAPPVPVRVDSKRFQQTTRDPPEDVLVQAPIARMEGIPTRPTRPVGNHSSAKDEEVMIAPVAHVERGRRPMPMKMAKNHGKDIEVEAVANTVQIVAYSADIEKPWVAPKRNEKQIGKTPLSINTRSSSNARSSGPFHKDARTDSYDSTSSFSSIQDRIPDFDPDTYVVKRRAPSTSSHGIRSDSSDSGSCHSFSSHASGGQEPRFDEDTYRIETKPSGPDRQNIRIGNIQSGQQSQMNHSNRESMMQSHVNQPNQPSGILSQMNKPRKMVVNVNGRTRISESSEPKETDSDSCSEYKQPEQRINQQTIVMRPASNEEDEPQHTISVRSVNDEQSHTSQSHCGGPHGCGETDDMKANEIKRMPTPLRNLQEMMGMMQAEEFEDKVSKRENGPQDTNDSKGGMIHAIQNEAENETEACQLKDLELVRVNSEEINEVFVENEESMPFSELLKDSNRDEEFKVENRESSGKSEDPMGPGPNPTRRMSAVHIQSRKQQQQQISCIGSGGAKNNGVFPGKRREQPKSPPVNIQMRRNSNRRSIPLDSLSITDAMKIEQLNNAETLKGNLLQPAQTKSPRTIRHKDNNEHAAQSPGRPAPLRDESIIVASAMSDDEDMDEDRLQKTFEMMNATADRILDQIDKVASFSSEDYFPDDYDDQCQTNGTTADDQIKTNYRLSTGSVGSSSSSTSAKENGYYKMNQFDLNGNQYDVDQYDNVSSYCQYKRTEPEDIMFPMTDDVSYRVSRPLVTATTATKRASTGVRITLPAINVKVSTSRTKGSRQQNTN